MLKSRAVRSDPKVPRHLSLASPPKGLRLAAGGATTLAACPIPLSPAESEPGVDQTQKIRQLLLLAKEQGHLTYDDVDEALSDVVLTPTTLEQILTKLVNLEVEIVHQAEVEQVKAPDSSEEIDPGRLETLDDPLRMYFRQMAKVPLLTREQ